MSRNENEFVLFVLQCVRHLPQFDLFSTTF